MTVSTKVAAIVVGGLLLAYGPARAQSTQAAAPATASAGAVTNGQSVLGFIAPLLNSSVEHKAAKNCKPDSLYSQHSVVGDPNACFVGKLDVRQSASIVPSAPTL
jgi:hypothetical protein